MVQRYAGHKRGQNRHSSNKTIKEKRFEVDISHEVSFFISKIGVIGMVEKTQAEKERDDVFTRNQKFGGVGEDIKPVEKPEEADETQFEGFKPDEEVK